MAINWTIIAYFVVGYFVISGFSRGWWKEAVTTVVLAALIFFLQNPTWAESFIDFSNGLIATIWRYIPGNIAQVINNILGGIFATGANSSGVFQIDATNPETWMTILLLVVGAAILFGQVNFGHQPTSIGKVLGGLVGGFNGFLILGLVREYLDGRALPGQEVHNSTITLAGGSAFGPASTDVSIQATGLPNYTILDSVIPWVVIGIGLVMLISVLKTRVGIASNKDGSKIAVKIPPFYQSPVPRGRVQPNPPVTPVRIVE